MLLSDRRCGVPLELRSHQNVSWQTTCTMFCYVTFVVSLLNEWMKDWVIYWMIDWFIDWLYIFMLSQKTVCHTHMHSIDVWYCAAQQNNFDRKILWLFHKSGFMACCSSNCRIKVLWAGSSLTHFFRGPSSLLFHCPRMFHGTFKRCPTPTHPENIPRKFVWIETELSRGLVLLFPCCFVVVVRLLVVRLLI